MDIRKWFLNKMKKLTGEASEDLYDLTGSLRETDLILHETMMDAAVCYGLFAHRSKEEIVACFVKTWEKFAQDEGLPAHIEGRDLDAKQDGTP